MIEDSVANTLKIFLQEENFEVSVLIVDNNFIKELNRNYRNVNKETDVLSFPIFEFKNGQLQEDIVVVEDEIPLGDIVISIEKALQQAKEFGHSLEREVAYLTVHSVLHLLGFDHIEEDDRKVMRKYEEQILDSMGLTR
ncbi:rRNA maturation RNase YbeY [Caldicellulosiruptor obsidiansis]|uniref:rRNA maturation RNase YbeY n=1 Tax=Caldicellulosiruptor obsidiansis TaxID=717609 RepID=UPI0038B706F3